MTTASLPTPVIERIRHELVRRELSVTAREMVTPHMIRITLTGEDLDSFVSASFDDHIKLLFPGEGEKPVMREYTPRRYDTEKKEVVIDFAVHAAGPATDWAVAAKVGDTLRIGGPRGSRRISGEIRRWVLIGDETALPAMGRFAEEAGAGDDITMIGAVRDGADEQVFESAAALDVRWVHRGEDATDPAPLLAAVQALETGAGSFVWIATEAGVAKTLREALVVAGQPLVWMKCAGYWTAGEADAKVNFD